MAISTGVLTAASVALQASQALKKPSIPKVPDPPQIAQKAQARVVTGGAADTLGRAGAGGSILSDQNANKAISDGANGVRKTLLGS